MSSNTIIEGEITDVAFKKGSKGEYVEVKLQQDGKKYPTTCRAFDGDLIARFHKAGRGMKVGFEIEEAAGDYQGKRVTYRNVVGIRPFGGVGSHADESEPLIDGPPLANRGQWDTTQARIAASWAITAAQTMFSQRKHEGPGTEEEHLAEIHRLAKLMLALRDKLATEIA